MVKMRPMAPLFPDFTPTPVSEEQRERERETRKREREEFDKDFDIVFEAFERRIFEMDRKIDYLYAREKSRGSGSCSIQ